MFKKQQLTKLVEMEQQMIKISNEIRSKKKEYNCKYLNKLVIAQIEEIEKTKSKYLIIQANWQNREPVCQLPLNRLPF